MRVAAGVDAREGADELRIHSIVNSLEHLDVPPEVVKKLRAIDPKRWFAVELVVTSYHSAEETDEQPSGYEPSKRRIRFVGIGRFLWYKIANVAEVGSIEDATVRDVSGALSVEERATALARDPGKQAWALWGAPRAKRQHVTTRAGERFEGKGDYERWKKERDARVGGRPRKRRGPRTYEAGTKAARADAASMRRRKAIDAKIASLRKQGRTREANALAARSDAARRGAAAPDIRGRGVFARGPTLHRKKRRKTRRRKT